MCLSVCPTASEIETKTMEMGISPGAAGLLGGMGGGVAQAYTTMGTCTLSRLSSNTYEFFDHTHARYANQLLALLAMHGLE